MSLEEVDGKAGSTAMPRIGFFLAIALIFPAAPGRAEDTGAWLRVSPLDDGFILRGEKIVRQVGPGVHSKTPLLERGITVPVRYIFSRESTLSPPLVDGTPCAIRMKSHYQFADSRRVLENVLATGRPLPKDGRLRQDAMPEPDALAAVDDTLSVFVATLSPDAAREGAIEAWLRTQPFDRTGHRDGTKLMDVELPEIGCSEVEPPSPPAQDPCRLVVFGDRQPFAHKGWARVAAGPSVTVAPRDPIEVLSRDQERFLVTLPTVTLTVPDGIDTNHLTSRVHFALSFWAKKTIGSIRGEDIAHSVTDSTFDEIESDLRKQLSPAITLLSVDFSASGYQTRELATKPGCVSD